MAISKKKKRTIWERDNERCWYCGKELALALGSEWDRNKIDSLFVVDHVIPKILGGTDAMDNLVSSCWYCNSQKGSRTLEEHRDHVRRVLAGQPLFSREQLDYLEAIGVSLPEPPSHMFWGEGKRRN